MKVMYTWRVKDMMNISLEWNPDNAKNNKYEVWIRKQEGQRDFRVYFGNLEGGIAKLIEEIMYYERNKQ